MGKSKKKRSHSPEKENRRLWKKLHKLENRLKERWSPSSRGTLSSWENDSEHNAKNSDSDFAIADDNISREQNRVVPTIAVNRLVQQSPLGDGTSTERVLDSATTTALTKESGESEIVPDDPKLQAVELDEEIVKIIGKEPETKPGDLILSQHIVTRWKHWLKAGLTKEVKGELLKKYSRTGDCPLEAPKLNAEVAASLNESSTKRDKYFSITQNLAGCALSALSQVIEPLVDSSKEEMNQKKALVRLWDVSQLLTEIHHGQTVARKACILPSLNKQITAVLEKTETDSHLFGEKLGEKIKESKSLNKIGQEIKTQAIFKKPAAQGNLKDLPVAKTVMQAGQRSRPYRRPLQQRPFLRRNQTSQSTGRSQSEHRQASSKKQSQK